MAEGMMNNPMATPEGAPMDQGAGGMPQQAVSMEDAVLDMHLTQDVKSALQGKGIDISAVADRGPKEPVVVLPSPPLLSSSTSLPSLGFSPVAPESFDWDFSIRLSRSLKVSSFFEVVYFISDLGPSYPSSDDLGNLPVAFLAFSVAAYISSMLEAPNNFLCSGGIYNLVKYFL